MTPTQQCLQTSTALCQPLIRVTLWEEHRARYPVGCRFKAEAHRHQQVFPAVDMTDFVLDALLRGVHRVLLATVDPLQRLLNLCTQFMLISLTNLTQCIMITVLWDVTPFRLENKYNISNEPSATTFRVKMSQTGKNVYNTQNGALKPGISSSQEETVAVFL